MNHVWNSLSLLVLLAAAAAAAEPVRDAARETDRRLESELQLNAADLAPITSDEAFLRRVFLDTIGQPPTSDDVLAFLLDDRDDKRARTIDLLLSDPRFGQNWASYWRNVVLFRRTEERAGIAAQALNDYFAEQLNQNTPWDRVATAFITASGDVRDNGAAGLIMAQGGRPEDTVSEISRIFLGIQIQCAQCHDHPTDRWRREQFHQLAAFFPRVAIRPVRADGRLASYEVVGSDLPSFRPQMGNNRFRGTPEHRMPDLNNPEKPGEVMQPVLFVSGDSLALGTSDKDRRDALAAWITSRNNPWFAKALVNRLWAELVGEGFYEPVDDLGPDREPQAADTLEYLTARFTDHGYDVKRLMTVIMNTSAYQRESRNRRQPGDVPFTANCAQRLRADQLFSSLLHVLEIGESSGQGAGDSGPYQLRGPRVVFNQAFGYDPSEARGEVQGTIPQALFLMNSPLVESGGAAGPALSGLLADYPDDQDLVTALYLKVLSRRPTADERQLCMAHVRGSDARSTAYEDLLWSLLNSTDFLHRR